ncbi:hypothetical protein JAAARDRAFT_61568 [Jaapia argillacea MUCL 33604]|uniref:DDE Tnp4 domain-containing protein n=1 Tax=Jaapia argillacea MUCL 33604 TaxID=933084 RepID=A0A067PRP0_9AGAM|nr:hypothetical protein JAAARDRAFT_61568 [Jaapia argillacea MUCL 33604]
MEDKFGCCAEQLSHCINKLCSFIWDEWGFLLDFDTCRLTTVKLSEYAGAIHTAGALIDLIWAFLDCTIIPICRPGDDQDVSYNGYISNHATKYQGATAPDGIIVYCYRPEVRDLTRDEQEFNNLMSKYRECVEWLFGKVVNYWCFVDLCSHLKLHLSPIGKYYLIAVLLMNAHTCLHGSQTSHYFDCPPLSLEEYFT